MVHCPLQENGAYENSPKVLAGEFLLVWVGQGTS